MHTYWVFNPQLQPPPCFLGEGGPLELEPVGKIVFIFQCDFTTHSILLSTLITDS
jgi:hypothetical protein